MDAVPAMECMDTGCCSTARLSVSSLFDRGYRRNRRPPLPVQGEPRTDAGGLTARFSLALRAATIMDIGYSASTCITLIAYCELLAELASGCHLRDAARLSARDLIVALPEVPELRRDRATLAVAAFRAALAEIDRTAIAANGGCA